MNKFIVTYMCKLCLHVYQKLKNHHFGPSYNFGTNNMSNLRSVRISTDGCLASVTNYRQVIIQFVFTWIMIVLVGYGILWRWS